MVTVELELAELEADLADRLTSYLASLGLDAHPLQFPSPELRALYDLIP